MVMKICEQCGKEFEAKRSDSKFCSPKCRLRSHRNVPEIRKCPLCHKEFKTNGKQIYCSEEHAEMARVSDQRHSNISQHDPMDYNTDTDPEDNI